MLKISAQNLKLFYIALSIIFAATAFGENRMSVATAIPVRFEHSVDAAKAKTGDVVVAKTIQVVILSDGRFLAKGATLIGHVVEAQPFHFNSTPYARQQPSELSIHFDKLQTGDALIPLSLAVRAIADVNESRDAANPHSFDDTDHVGMMKLIGGEEYSPISRAIMSDDGDVIGYNRKNGIFARLVAAVPENASGIHCNSTDTEQSIAIFAPGACGAYGFGGAFLTSSGQDGSGTFALAARGYSVNLYAGTSALLQVITAQ
jgi:hypothetical protein